MSCLEFSPTFKVILLGDQAVGKSSIIKRYCDGVFMTDLKTTIGVDFLNKLLTVDGTKVKLQFWDTAGQERFRGSIIGQIYHNVHAVVFVYDVLNRNSVKGVKFWMEECKAQGIKLESIPVILIGNKCDLSQVNTTQHDIIQNAARLLAQTQKMIWYETSAKLDSEASHLDEIFMLLVRALKSTNPQAFPQYNKNTITLKAEGTQTNKKCRC